MIHIISMYASIGLAVAVAYMAYVGNLIKNKYGCSLIEGIAKFENAGDPLSNILTVLVVMVVWPAMLRAALTGKWKKKLGRMVDENNY